jgi:hypothetical protein
VGFKLNVTNEKLLLFKINRLHWSVKSLGRDITPLELNGLLKTIQLSGVILALFFYFVIGSILSFAFLGLLFAPALLNIYAEYKIAAEDEQLENDFPDLYIVLYTRLLKGSDVRLAPTLKDYLLSFDSMDNGTGKYKNVIRNFVLDFRNNIEIYGDDGIAVLKLRDKYQSAMIINFCNLVTQSLNGVANSDKLLAFKIELNNKRIEQMESKADVLVRKGNRAVMFVYLILAQFVILSWVAKLALAGGIMSLFGGG